MKHSILITVFFAILLLACNPENTQNKSDIISQIQNDTSIEIVASCSPRIATRNQENGLILLNERQKVQLSENLKKLNPDLPIIGLLMYDNVLTTELTAPLDVFTKRTQNGELLFNVITIAESYDFIVSEEGLKMFPDFTLENSPKLDILIVPSAYDMSLQVKNQHLVDFIKSQNNNT